MEISYKLEADDLIALQKFHQKKSLPPWAFLLIVVSAAIGMQIIPLLLHVRRFGWQSRGVQNVVSVPGLLSMLLPLLFFVVFWVFVLRFAPQRQAKEVIKNSAVFSNIQTMRVEPDGIFRRDASGEQRLLWSALHDVAQSENQIFFFSEKDAAHIIPKRAFANSDQAQQFFEGAEEYWKAAGGKAETPPIPAPH